MMMISATNRGLVNYVILWTELARDIELLWKPLGQATRYPSLLNHVSFSFHEPKGDE